MNGQESQLTVAQAVYVGMRVLGLGVKLWATLILSFGLFAWAIISTADWRVMGMRLVGATVFTLLVHVIAWWRAKGQE